MKTRFCNLIQSPDAGEGMLINSKYSTERSPTTALLFEAQRTVVLPRVTLEEGDLSGAEVSSKAEWVVGCSVQEH
ncbi:MAG TPA: hypothetical protein VG938_19900 [Verrucomicrobiae bacterium]|jgi:hypothetical protein|nr:hypothetical protein [Verrucomicrobiae bacterium]